MTPPSSKVALLGCAAALFGVVTLLLLTLELKLLWIVPAAVAFLLAAYGIKRWRVKALVRQFREQFGPGKDLLFIYTNSPHWRPRIENEWLNEWSHRAIVLNRSTPWRHNQVEARLWRVLGGLDEHTPLAIVIPASGRPTVVRFFRGFRDFKHGKPARLLEAEARLRQALAKSGSITAT